VTASYSGDSNNASSSATAALILIISKEASTTAASVTPTVSQQPGSTFNFSAAVSPTSVGTPTGTVNLVLSGTTTVLASATLSNGKATISYAPPGTGQYQVVYVGDVNFTSSTSSAVGVSIQPLNFTISLPSNTLTVTDGQSVTTTVTLTSVSGYTGSLTLGALNTLTNVATSPCNSLPAYTTCTFAFTSSTTAGNLNLGPGTFPLANSTTTFTMTVNTDVPPAEPYPYPAGIVLLPGGLGGLAALVLGRRRRRNSRAHRLMLFAVAIALSGVALGLGGCGSGGSQYATPKGTTPIVLTVSGSPATGAVSLTNPDIVNSLTFQLTVQ